MPTIRSEFSFEQFRERLQNYAYKLACDVISDPGQHGRIRIIMNGCQMQEIETKEFTIKFYAKHASFSRNAKVRSKYATDGFYTTAIWGFDVEDKEYTNSNHRSKISYFGADMTKYNPKTMESETDLAKVDEIKQHILDFINKLMEGVKPVPRFALRRNIVHGVRRADRLQEIWNMSYPMYHLTKEQVFRERAKAEGFTDKQIDTFLALP